jgi:hypothetical protein
MSGKIVAGVALIVAAVALWWVFVPTGEISYRSNARVTGLVPQTAGEVTHAR